MMLLSSLVFLKVNDARVVTVYHPVTIKSMLSRCCCRLSWSSMRWFRWARVIWVIEANRQLAVNLPFSGYPIGWTLNWRQSNRSLDRRQRSRIIITTCVCSPTSCFFLCPLARYHRNYTQRTQCAGNSQNWCSSSTTLKSTKLIWWWSSCDFDFGWRHDPCTWGNESLRGDKMEFEICNSMACFGINGLCWNWRGEK